MEEWEKILAQIRTLTKLYKTIVPHSLDSKLVLEKILSLLEKVE